MTNDNQNIHLGQAASQFLASIPAEERTASQQEVYRFARWYNLERPLDSLTAHEVANYAERLSLSDTDYAKKLELIRAFLVYGKKEGWSRTNLATHLKTKKVKTKVTRSSRGGLPQTISLTPQGHAELQAELITLKDKRLQAIDEIHKAAADKDFRENAPLEAAREQHGQLEGRIKELEETLKSATIIDEKEEATPRVNIGDSIVLHDLASGEESRYVIVSPREVDAIRGKISSASPVGKAIIGRNQGETIEVMTPAGKLFYQLKQIER
jgi:transcription elongation factor GreA